MKKKTLLLSALLLVVLALRTKALTTSLVSCCF
jgi:hypothetical protein